MVILTKNKDKPQSNNKRAFVVIDGEIIERVQGRTKIKYYAIEEGETKP